MTHVDLFTKAGLVVTGWAPVAEDSAPPRGPGAPIGTHYLVWGYRAAIRRAAEAAERVRTGTCSVEWTEP